MPNSRGQRVRGAPAPPLVVFSLRLGFEQTQLKDPAATDSRKCSKTELHPGQCTPSLNNVWAPCEREKVFGPLVLTSYFIMLLKHVQTR